MTARSVPDWIGSTPDAAIPARVRLRVFERFGGICQLTSRKIMPGDQWDLDHIKPLAMGGEHVESNLQPVLRIAHREKTKRDVADLAKARRIKAKHIGVEQSPPRLQSRGFTKSPPQKNRASAPVNKTFWPVRSD